MDNHNGTIESLQRWNSFPRKVRIKILFECILAADIVSKHKPIFPGTQHWEFNSKAVVGTELRMFWDSFHFHVRSQFLTQKRAIVKPVENLSYKQKKKKNIPSSTKRQPCNTCFSSYVTEEVSPREQESWLSVISDQSLSDLGKWKRLERDQGRQKRLRTLWWFDFQLPVGRISPNVVSSSSFSLEASVFPANLLSSDWTSQPLCKARSSFCVNSATF